jgi:hypothetical protein
MRSLILVSTSWILVACSDESDPAPIAAAGTGGNSAGSGGASTGGAAMGGSSMGGATGGAAGAGGRAGGILVMPFEPVVLFDFDAADPAAAASYGWLPEPTGSLQIVNDDRDPSNATPGALRFTAVFEPYDTLGQSQTSSAIYTFGDATTGTTQALSGGTRVHFWVRLASPAGVPESLAFFQPFIQGGAATTYTNNFGYVTPDMVSDNLWHEFVLEVAGQTYMNDVWRVGLAVAPAPLPPTAAADAGEPVAAADAGTDAGGAAPAPITFDIDYVWVE